MIRRLTDLPLVLFGAFVFVAPIVTDAVRAAWRARKARMLALDELVREWRDER